MYNGDMHIYYATFFLAITPPMTGAAIILFAVEHPPRLRSTLAFGIMVLFSAFALAALGVASAILDGRQPFFPYLLMTGLPALTVARMMQIEFRQFTNHKNTQSHPF